MIKKSIALLFIVLCSAGLLLSCSDDDNPTGPGNGSGQEPVDSEFAKVIVHTVDEYGNPYENVGIRLQYQRAPGDVIGEPTAEYTVDTDDRGIALFDSLTTGEVSIRCYSASSEYNIIQYNESCTLVAGQLYEFTFCYPKDPIRLDIIALMYINSEYVPMPGVTITLDDYLGDNIHTGENPYQVTTDADGHASIISADPGRLTFDTGWLILEKNGHDGRGNGDFAYDNGILTLTIKSNESPEYPIIHAPEKGEEYIGSTVRLICEGYDFEDGKLPAEAFIWFSTKDGELGTGNDITVNLSIGEHVIDIRATDSSGRRTEYGLQDRPLLITVSHYDTTSYFPFPFDAYWRYKYDPAAIDVINERGETEHWTLDDMSVTAEKYDTRTCQMNWTCERDGEQAVCQYTVTDHLVLEENQFAVTSTDEYLTIHTEDDVLIEDLEITTAYDPYIVCISDVADPAAGGYSVSQVQATSHIAYTLADVGTHTNIITETIGCSYEPGSAGQVATDFGTYDTIPVITRIGNIERTWHLAPGIGIFQFTSDLAGNMITGQLAETNMDSYVPAARMAGLSSPPVVLRVDNEKERLETLRQVMRGYCPF